jgi:hypothetical protein
LQISLDPHQVCRLERPSAGTGAVGAAFSQRGEFSMEEATMGRGLLLWLIGIPLPIILIVWLLGGLN